jgi:hypothetical protein
MSEIIEIKIFSAIGEQGDIGADAYEVAVEAGFVGTRQEWLDSLKGELVEPTVVPADSPDISVLKFDDLNGRFYGTQVFQTGNLSYIFDFTNAKISAPILIFSGATQEPEFLGASQLLNLGGAFIEGNSLISLMYVGDGVVVMAFLASPLDPITGYDRVLNLGEQSGSVTINLRDSENQPIHLVTVTLTGAVTLSFTNTPPLGVEQSFSIRVTNVEAITWPSGTLFNGGAEPLLVSPCEIPCSINNAGALTVYGVINGIETNE